MLQNVGLLDSDICSNAWGMNPKNVCASSLELCMKKRSKIQKSIQRSPLLVMRRGLSLIGLAVLKLAAHLDKLFAESDGVTL